MDNAEKNKIDAKYRIGVEAITISVILDLRKHSAELKAYKNLSPEDLDAYKNANGNHEIPGAIRVAYNEAMFYHRTGDVCKVTEWCDKLYDSTGNSNAAKKRKHIAEVIEKVKTIVRILKRDCKLTCPRL